MLNLGCQPCNGNETLFYCQLSHECIPKHQVCDEKYDCKYQEDERWFKKKHQFHGIIIFTKVKNI